MDLSYNALKVFLPLVGLMIVGALAKAGYDWFNRDFLLPTSTLLVLSAALQVATLDLFAERVARSTRRRLEVDPV